MYNLKYKIGSRDVEVPTYSQVKGNQELKYLEHPFDAVSYLVEFYFPLVVESYENARF